MDRTWKRFRIDIKAEGLASFRFRLDRFVAVAFETGLVIRWFTSLEGSRGRQEQQERKQHGAPYHVILHVALNDQNQPSQSLKSHQVTESNRDK